MGDFLTKESRPTAVLERTVEEMAERPFVLLGHDPGSAEKVDELAELGVSIAEFPVAYPATRRVRDIGQWVTMGAPNIVRGGAISGSLNTAGLAAEGLLDILCGDYHGPCLLYAAMMLQSPRPLRASRDGDYRQPGLRLFAARLRPD